MEVYEKYRREIRKKLPEKRYIHSLLVADKALSLAKRWGADENKAYTAGIFHDILKYESDEKLLKLITDGGIILNCSQLRNPAVWHAYGSAVYIRDVLGIKDEDIFDAVFYHSTGKENMPLLTKIIYLADMISDDRVYSEANILRSLSEEDLDKAVETAISMSIDFLKQKNCALCDDTYKAYVYLRGE